MSLFSFKVILPGGGDRERLTPVTLPEAWYVIVHPGVHVSTASVFQALN
jgi:4-diphosphocytidyl-2C-methyl-D-erythritol kinase